MLWARVIVQDLETSPQGGIAGSMLVVPTFKLTLVTWLFASGYASHPRISLGVDVALGSTAHAGVTCL